MLNLLSKFEIYSPFAFLLMKIGRAAFLKNDFVPNNEGELPTLACLLTFMPCTYYLYHAGCSSNFEVATNFLIASRAWEKSR